MSAPFTDDKKDPPVERGEMNWQEQAEGWMHRYLELCKAGEIFCRAFSKATAPYLQREDGSPLYAASLPPSSDVGDDEGTIVHVEAFLKDVPGNSIVEKAMNAAAMLQAQADKIERLYDNNGWCANHIGGLEAKIAALTAQLAEAQEAFRKLAARRSLAPCGKTYCPHCSAEIYGVVIPPPPSMAAETCNHFPGQTECEWCRPVAAQSEERKEDGLDTNKRNWGCGDLSNHPAGGMAGRQTVAPPPVERGELFGRPRGSLCSELEDDAYAPGGPKSGHNKPLPPSSDVGDLDYSQFERAAKSISYSPGTKLVTPSSDVGELVGRLENQASKRAADEFGPYYSPCNLLEWEAAAMLQAQAAEIERQHNTIVKLQTDNERLYDTAAEHDAAQRAKIAALTEKLERCQSNYANAIDDGNELKWKLERYRNGLEAISIQDTIEAARAIALGTLKE